MFTWSIFANVGETISDAGRKHRSMFSKRRRTREKGVLQGLWKEKVILKKETQTNFVWEAKRI